MLFQLQAIFSKNIVLLINFIFSQGYLVTFGETWRTPEMAQIYFKEHKGILNSLHCKRLAIDLNFLDQKGHYITDSKAYAVAGKYWESLDGRNRWGGNFKQVPGDISRHSKCFCDATHFEMRDDILLKK